MAKAAKKNPPSRVRYEAANPTVSCRVPKEVYDRLEVVRGKEGRSFADVLKIGLGILEVRAKKEGKIREEAYEEAYGEGYAVGYQEAEGEYEVVYTCKVCRKSLTVTSDQERQAISQYMQEHGWGHEECLQGRR